MLRPLLGMTGRRLIEHLTLVTFRILLYLVDNLAEMRLVHTLLRFGQDLDIALTQTGGMMVTTCLALLLSYSSCSFALLKVGGLVS